MRKTYHITRARSRYFLSMGYIEYGTTELAKEIAKNDFNYFNFEGLKKKSGKLHVTSHKFNHPGLEGMLKESDASVSIHGRYIKSLKKPTVCIGGLNEKLKTLIRIHLEGAGFKVDLEKFPATYPGNVANRAKNKGVQLELNRDLRESLFENLFGGDRKPTEKFYAFTDAVRTAIDKYLSL